MAIMEDNEFLRPRSRAQLRYIEESNANAMAKSSTAASAAVSGGVESTVKADEGWINKRWRPMMAWSYMVVCLFDFLFAPILWSIIQALTHGGVVSNQWQPITLQGAGLYHVAMGTVLGITAYGRTKEKTEGKA